MTMPKVTSMPAPPQARPNRVHTEQANAEEALRAAQRPIDSARDRPARAGAREWRRRAMMAETEIKRLAKARGRIAANARAERRSDSPMSAISIAIGSTASCREFHTAGEIILGCWNRLRARSTERQSDQVGQRNRQGRWPTAGRRTTARQHRSVAGLPGRRTAKRETSNDRTVDEMVQARSRSGA